MLLTYCSCLGYNRLYMHTFADTYCNIYVNVANCVQYPFCLWLCLNVFVLRKHKNRGVSRVNVNIYCLKVALGKQNCVEVG